MRSRSIAVSTSGFHPDNAGSTPAEITKDTSKKTACCLFLVSAGDLTACEARVDHQIMSVLPLRKKKTPIWAILIMSGFLKLARVIELSVIIGFAVWWVWINNYI